MSRHPRSVFETLAGRELGAAGARPADALAAASGSEALLQRLALQRRLAAHQGCVNTCAFTPDGGLLLSGSDDTDVCVWDWHAGALLQRYASGHRGNVFQARALPGTNAAVVVTSAADGAVRLGERHPGGGAVATARVGKHQGRAHKLALQPGAPDCWLSAGEDGEVRHYDRREPPAASRRLLVCRAGAAGRVVELYSVAFRGGAGGGGGGGGAGRPDGGGAPPLFCLGGADAGVQVFDLRRTPGAAAAPGAAGPVRRLAPAHLRPASGRAHVTAAVWGRGGEILATYNDEDVYLFAAEGQRRPGGGGDAGGRGGGGKRAASADGGDGAPAARRARPDLGAQVQAQQQQQRRQQQQRPQDSPPDSLPSLASDDSAGGPAPPPGAAATERADPRGPGGAGGASEEEGGDDSDDGGSEGGDGSGGSDDDDDDDDGSGGSDDDDEDDDWTSGDDSGPPEWYSSDDDRQPGGAGSQGSDSDGPPPPGAAPPHVGRGAGAAPGTGAAGWSDGGGGGWDGVLQRFCGHRNAQTIKGVAFMGAADEWVASGSDCGHLFVWRREGGRLAAMLRGDRHVVNCLEPHPAHALTLATSGIDSDVKIWAPTGGAARPPGAEAARRAAANRRGAAAARAAAAAAAAAPDVEAVLAQAARWYGRQQRRAAAGGGASGSDEGGGGGGDDDDDDDDDAPLPGECAVQ